MGMQRQLTSALKNIEKEKMLDIGRRQQEFRIEVDFLQAHYGRRFVGVLDVSKKGIISKIQLERTSLPFLKKGRIARASMGPAEFEKLGYTIVMTPYPVLYWYLPLCVPPWLDFAVSWHIKRQILKGYGEIVRRRGMVFYSFMGDQNGTWVAATDVREMSAEEKRMLRP